jgi:hypothetical protein
MGRNYYAYELSDAKLLLPGSPSIVEVDVLYANQIEFATDRTELTFEGDAQSRKVFITSGITANLRPDSVPLAALETAYAKTPVTTSLPAALARATYFGDLVESKGVTSGLYGRGYAIKEESGVEEVVDIEIRIFKGTLNLSGPPNLQTKQKAQGQTMSLSAVRTSTDVNGTALPSVPTGGAFYWLAELT